MFLIGSADVAVPTQDVPYDNAPPEPSTAGDAPSHTVLFLVTLTAFGMAVTANGIAGASSTHEELPIFITASAWGFAGLGLILEPAALERFGRRLKVPNRFERVGNAVAKDGQTLFHWRTAEPAVLLRALQQAGALQLDAQERRDDFLEVLALLEEAQGEFESGALALLATGLAGLGAEAAIKAAEAKGAVAPQGRALGDAISRLRATHIAMVQGSVG